MSWSKNHDSCRDCGGAENPHMAGGLCRVCYLRAYRNDPDRKKTSAAGKKAWRERNLVHILGVAKERRERVHYDGMRDAALARDGSRCAKCGSAERLVVHHKDGNGRDSPDPNNDLKNLVTECRACHMREHMEELIESRKLSTLGKWAHRHECCVSCGTTEKKHGGKGMCVNCRARLRRKTN